MKRRLLPLALLSLGPWPLGCDDDLAAGGDMGDMGVTDLPPGSDRAAGPDIAIPPDFTTPPDLIPPCMDGQACVVGTQDGVCRSATCVPCTDVTDDGACRTAYGGVAMAPYLCLNGGCVPGDCRTDTDCGAPASGRICGLTSTNTCGSCASDAQCRSDATYGANFICNINTGKCVSSACVQIDNASCTSNPRDVCCSSACVSGNCCDTASCRTRFGSTSVCANHLCSSCDPVTSKTYLVDPVNGDDTAATGSGTAGASPNNVCRFRTISRALAAIGPATAGTSVIVLGPSTVAAGETFPINVPANVALSSMGGAVTLKPPAGQVGIRLAATPASVTGFTIDGAANGVNAAFHGIRVTAGANAMTTVTEVTVQKMVRDGILVEAGSVTLGPGVVSTQNGTAGGRASGLRVNGSGRAIIAVPANQTPARFNANAGYGILVQATGSVNLTGVPGAGSTGTVTTNGNSLAGLAVQQTPGAQPQSSVSGLVTFANDTTDMAAIAHGLALYAGSSVRVRGSVALSNQGSGVYITGFGGSNDVSRLDLGTMSDPGRNTLQAPPGMNPNVGVGVCLNIALAGIGGRGQTLAARGNLFARRDCTTASPGALTRNDNCAGRSDIGIDDTGALGTPNDIDTASCTHP